MKFGCLRTPAFTLLIVAALLSCTGAAQTAIYVGKCNTKTWADCNSTTMCPSSGAGSCNMVISDSNGVAIATQQGGSRSTYVCVEPNTTIQWIEGTATESFVVNFGTSTPFSNSKAIFAGKAGTNDSGTIASNGGSVPECNEYVILHCGAGNCTLGDPIVVVHGGITLKGKTPHRHKPSASKQ